MIGRCHHAALRFRILLLLITFVLFYGITWLSNFRTLSHHGKTYSSNKITKIVLNDTLDDSIMDTFKYLPPISLNMTNKSKPTKTITELAIGDKPFQFTKDNIARQNDTQDDQTLINGTYVDINSHKLTKNDTSHIGVNKEHMLPVVKSNHSDKFELDQTANNIFTTKRPKGVKPDIIRNINRRLVQNINQTSLLQLSLYYKPKSATEPPKLFPWISANQNKKEQSRKMPFELLQNKNINKSRETNNNSNLNRKMLLKESGEASFNGKWAGDHHLINITSSFLNKTELNASNVANTTKNSSLEQPFERRTFVSCNSSLHDSNKIKVGILIPSSTRKIESPTLQNLSLIKTSLPSIYETWEEVYVYRIYIGIDDGDFLQTVQGELTQMFDCVIPVIGQGKNYVKSVNTIADRAYKDGMDYLVRTNDDTLFVTKNWTTIGINKLREYHPENVGVVGPTCKEGNTNILTHDMVHRKHLEIFDFYYPPYLENWWTDDWITHVYEPKKSSKLTSWIVKHVMFNTRYNVNFERQKWAEILIKYDKTRLQNYIGCNCDICESSAYCMSKHVSVVTTLLPCFILLIL